MEKYITIADENNLISLAHQYGYKWQRLKEHPNNAQLFNQHPDHLRLPRGQQLYLPKHQTKTEPLALYTTNVFVLKNKTRYFSVILCWPDKTPIANRPYQLDIGPIPVLENSASNGLVEHRLPAKTPRQVTLTVWPYSEHPDESIEWTFELNTYEHKGSSKGNKNYLTLHRHTILEQSQISQEIEAEATDNSTINKDKGVHSSATGITSTRNLHPQLLQQGLEFLKHKHKIRLLEEKSQEYKENQENMR